LVEQRTFIVGLAPDILEVTHATQVTVAAEMADSKNLFQKQIGRAKRRIVPTPTVDSLEVNAKPSIVARTNRE
jgi:hypothetical protein